jgi:hypothetical protein
MQAYTQQTRRRMTAFFKTLSEKDRRRYAAVEADKLGRGGTQAVCELFQIDPKTVGQGRAELDLPADPAPGRVRKKGADANRSWT